MMNVHRGRRDQPYLLKSFHLACVEIFLFNEESFLSSAQWFSSLSPFQFVFVELFVKDF